MNTSAPIPPPSRPGTSTKLHRSTDAGCLHHQEGAEQRRTEQGADRGEAPGRPDQRNRLLRRITLDQQHRTGRQARPDRDERCLRPDNGAEPEADHRRNHDPGEITPGRSAVFESLRRFLPAVAW